MKVTFDYANEGQWAFGVICWPMEEGGRELFVCFFVWCIRVQWGTR